MTIKRVSSSGKANGPAATSSAGPTAAPTKAFSVEAPAGAAPTAPTAEPMPLSERVVESTRHLRGLPAADLQMIQENLADKLEHDPQFIDLVLLAAERPKG